MPDETANIIKAIRKIDVKVMKKESMDVRGDAFNRIVDVLVERLGVTVRTEVKLFDLFE